MSTGELHNEHLLFQQTGEGNEQAFRQIYAFYYPRLYGFVLHTVRCEEDAEEILQEVFTRLWLHRQRLAAKGYSGSWLFRVAANLSFDYLRKAASKHKLHSLLRRQLPENGFDNVTCHIRTVEAEKLFSRVLSELPEQQRRVFTLSRYEGLSYQEIASRLRLSPHTVRNHLSNAFRTLRKALYAGFRLFCLLLVLHLL